MRKPDKKTLQVPPAKIMVDPKRVALVETAMLGGKTESHILAYYAAAWGSGTDEVREYMQIVRMKWLHTYPKEVQRAEHRARLLDLYRRAIDTEAIVQARFILQDLATLDSLNLEEAEKAITISLEDAKAKLSSNRMTLLEAKSVIEDPATSADPDEA